MSIDSSGDSSEISSNSENNNKVVVEIEILNSLSGFIGGEPFGQYLSEYLTNTQRNIDRLGHAIAAEDFDRIRQMAHKLKGSAGNIGAMKLTNICEKLQSMAEDEFQGKMCDEFFELQDIYQETKEALNGYIQQIDQASVKFG